MATTRITDSNLKKAVHLFCPKTKELTAYDYLNFEFKTGGIFKYGQLFDKKLNFEGFENLDIIPSIFSKPSFRFLCQPYMTTSSKNRNILIFDTSDLLQYKLEFDFEDKEADVQILSVEEKNSTGFNHGVTHIEIFYCIVDLKKKEKLEIEAQKKEIKTEFYYNKLGKRVQKTGPFIKNPYEKNPIYPELKIKSCTFSFEESNKEIIQIKNQPKTIISKKLKKKKYSKGCCLPLNLVKLTENYFYSDLSGPEIISTEGEAKNITQDFLQKTTMESDCILYRNMDSRCRSMEVVNFHGNFLGGNFSNDGCFLISDVTYNALGEGFEDHEIRRGYSPYEEGLCIIDLLRYEAYYLKEKKNIKILKIWRSGKFEKNEAFLEVEKDEKPRPGKDNQILKVIFFKTGEEYFLYEGTLKKNLKVNNESFEVESRSEMEEGGSEDKDDDLSDGKGSNFKLKKYESEPVLNGNSLDYNDGDFITDVKRIPNLLDLEKGGNFTINKDKFFFPFNEEIYVLENDKILSLRKKSIIIPSYMNTYYHSVKYFGSDFQKNLTLPKIKNSLKLMVSLLKSFGEDEYRLKLLKRALEQFDFEENEEVMRCIYLYFWPEFENINTKLEEIV